MTRLAYVIGLFGFQIQRKRFGNIVNNAMLSGTGIFYRTTFRKRHNDNENENKYFFISLFIMLAL